jgi:tRNA 2-thiouridine synthesizing protein A
MALPVKTVDAKGLSCPMPIIRLSQAMADMAIGQVIKVVATDQSFVPDIAAWCRKTGHELVDLKEGEEEIVALIKKLK